MTRERARQWFDALIDADRIYNTGKDFTGWYLRCLNGVHVFIGRRVRDAVDYLQANQQRVELATEIMP
jgi:hypothetical protein